MKRSLVISIALSLSLLLCACAGGVPEESPLSAVFPDQTSQMEASRFDGGGSVTWDLTGEESASLERWALALDLTAESFPEGEAPGDRDGGSGYTFQLGGQSFSYILTGADAYVLLGDTWYRVENPSDPPLSVPGGPELTAEDVERVEAYHFIVPADAEKKACTDSAAIQEVLDLLQGAAAAETPPEAVTGGATVSFRLTLTTGEVREWICAEAADTLWAVTGPEGSCETMIDCAALWEALPGEAEAVKEAELPVLP